jgi:GT2 family glycosyltransferase
MVMRWDAWDDVGPFSEPGGPGGSEDVDWCQRAASRGYRFAVTNPHCVIHTGLINSRGQPIVGQDLVIQRNRQIEDYYGIRGKVIYG